MRTVRVSVRIALPDYPDIPLGPDEFHTPNTIAEALIRQAGQYLAGDLSREGLRESLGIDSPDPQDYFTSSLAPPKDRFDIVNESVGDASPSVLVTSHVSTFGVSFDCHQSHSHEGEYHFGSLALRLALAATDPAGCLSGHTHQQGLTAIETASEHANACNPGVPGAASVTVGKNGAIQTKTLDGF